MNGKSAKGGTVNSFKMFKKDRTGIASAVERRKKILHNLHDAIFT